MTYYPPKLKKTEIFTIFFSKFSQARKQVLDVHLASTHAKFQLITSIIGLDIVKKPYRLMTSFFKLKFWAFLEVAQE